MAKSKEELEAIRNKMRQNPSLVALANNIKDPDSPEAAEWRKKGNEAMQAKWRKKREQQEEVARKAEEMATTLEAINRVAQDPMDIMKLMLNEALQEGDNEAAFKLVKELAEYKHGKKTRVETVDKTKQMGDLTAEELKELAELKEDLE